MNNESIQIRLEELHYLFTDSLNGEKSRIRLNDIDLYKRNEIVSRNAFAMAILPLDIYLVLEGSRSCEEVLKYSEEDRKKALSMTKERSRRATLNRVFKNEGTHGAKERFQEVVNLLTYKNRHVYDTFDNCRYRLNIEGNWNRLLQTATEAEKEHLYHRVKQLISDLPDSEDKETSPKLRLGIAMSHSLAEALSCLTLIACTLHIWNEMEISDNDKLAKDIILPSNKSRATQLLPSQKILKRNSDRARKIFQGIQEEFPYVEMSVDSARRCYQKGLEILDIKPMDDAEILGGIYYILYRCCKNKSFSSPDGMSADFYLTQSQKYKYPEAMKISLESRKITLYDLPPRGISPVTGICIVNEKNHASDVLIESLPENWKQETFDGTFTHDGNTPHKYFLCDQSTSKNYSDLLQILDFYKRSWSDDVPYDVEIFILGKEDYLASLIDTAQQYMENRIIPIHIVNEAKIAAQYLLAKHPLFFPVLDYPADPKQAKPQTLHFVLIGTDECARYLLTTAYWMMTFPDTQISPKISVIGNNTDDFLDHILSRCPGLEEDISDTYPTLEPYKSEISHIRVENFSSSKFDHALRNILESGDKLYFAISTGDDSTNLGTAIMLRERMIQFYVMNGYNEMLKNLPPIAFRCQDFHIANMSQKMVVNVLNHGNSWYNNHAIIPFGLDSDIYSWNSFMENPIEDLSKCISLIYNNHSIPDDPALLTNEKKMELKQQLHDYYAKQYNKGSSFAVALSIPYRLFSCVNKSHRILPESWSITNSETYYNYDVLSFLADKLAHMPESEIYKLARWEHDRWVRWMLSEGWIPASVDDILLYNKEGSEKHQLHIAKMHPCICDWDELAHMEEDLSAELGKPVDFRSFDVSSAAKTEEILRGAAALR